MDRPASPSSAVVVPTWCAAEEVMALPVCPMSDAVPITLSFTLRKAPRTRSTRSPMIRCGLTLLVSAATS